MKLITMIILLSFPISYSNEYKDLPDCKDYQTHLDFDVSVNSLNEMIDSENKNILVDCDGFNITIFLSFSNLNCDAFIKDFDNNIISTKKFELDLMGFQYGVGLTKEDTWFWIISENQLLSLNSLIGKRYTIAQAELLGQGIINLSLLYGNKDHHSKKARRSGGGLSASAGVRTATFQPYYDWNGQEVAKKQCAI